MCSRNYTLMETTMNRELEKCSICNGSGKPTIPTSATTRPTLDEFYLSLLDNLASRSTCARRRVAAIITDVRGRVLSMGYNGVPRGVTHCTDSPCDGVSDPPGNSSRCLAVHAETNALLQCRDLESACVIYCSCMPCFGCAKMILNTNIRRVVAKEKYAESEGGKLLAWGLAMNYGDGTRHDVGVFVNGRKL